MSKPLQPLQRLQQPYRPSSPAVPPMQVSPIPLQRQLSALTLRRLHQWGKYKPNVCSDGDLHLPMGAQVLVFVEGYSGRTALDR